MAMDYLSDSDVWVCVCSARLAELDQAGGLHRFGSEWYENVARTLLQDGTYQAFGPAIAAEVYMHEQTE